MSYIPNGKTKSWAKGKEFVARRICEVCRNQFYAPPVLVRRGGGKFCSKKCKGVASRKKLHDVMCRKCRKRIVLSVDKLSRLLCNECAAGVDYAKKNRKITDKECQLCKIGFKSYTKKYCSRRCYGLSKRIPDDKKKSLDKTSVCEKCGTGFYASPGHIKAGWGKYCSMNCRPTQRYSRGKGGYREDLGIYVRSTWEANYARYLNFLVKKSAIKSWSFEEDTFDFVGIRRGTRSYTPDFKITENDSSIVYHEVKGYMDGKSKVKLKRMKKYYPHIRIVLIQNKEMMEIKRKVGSLLKWENGTNDKLGKHINPACREGANRT